MKYFFKIFLVCVLGSGCSNTSEFETGEIRIIQVVKNALLENEKTKVFLDTRQIISRKKIDAAKVPVLFIELENGQNGTLTLYPGKGYGETWLGSDGTTVTLERGILKATRGMKNDIMGSEILTPLWSQISGRGKHTRRLNYLNGDNKITSKVFSCEINVEAQVSQIEIFDHPFETKLYRETCISETDIINNLYYLDKKGIVRKSRQYHGPSLGYLITERLDR